VVVREEPAESFEPNIIKIDGDFEDQISEFGATPLKKAGEGEYSTTKARYGALAASDPDRHSLTQKDSRFAINPLLRDPLAIEEEERRFLETRVREEVAAIEAEAREEGYRAGHAEGLARGESKAYEEVRVAAMEGQQRFNRWVETLESAKGALLAANEQFLVELVLKISRHVILRELKTETGYVTRLVRELIDRMGVRDNLTLRVSLKDFETASEIRSGLEAHLGTLKNLRIEPSPKVLEGGCLIETDWSVIDAAVETQLAAFHESLIASVDVPAVGAPDRG